jgi:D-glycero-D-manno-heptose 1,7-bisphosphate phosphatase
MAEPTNTPNATARAVFLDRDGTLNRGFMRDGKPIPPKTLDQFEILPGVVEATRVLKEAGFLLIVATNQPDVVRGTQTRETIEAMHRVLAASLPLDGIMVCYEDDGPLCTRYKPKPGMLLDAARIWGIDLAQSYMVGDRWRDVDCAKNAGCFSVFIDCGYDEALRSPPDAVCGSVAEAAEIILQRLSSGL